MPTREERLAAAKAKVEARKAKAAARAAERRAKVEEQNAARAERAQGRVDAARDRRDAAVGRMRATGAGLTDTAGGFSRAWDAGQEPGRHRVEELRGERAETLERMDELGDEAKAEARKLGRSVRDIFRRG